MNIAVLYSGGKDSNMAFFKVKDKYSIKCLISLRPRSEESYMFHFPNIELVKKQAEVIGLPLIFIETDGEKEKELIDLKKAILIAKEKYDIKGLVSGALASNYQKSRIEKICKELSLESITPLWYIDLEEYLNEIVKNKFEVIIISISADGFDENWLGRKINKGFIEDLKELNRKYGIHLGFEGGEAETFVLNAPFFKKRLKVLKSERIMENKNTGRLIIKVE